MANKRLRKAAEDGDNDEIDKALSGVYGPVSINARNKDGCTALLLAARKGRTATVEFLLNRGGNVYTKDMDGWTALHCAARNGHTATVDLLVDNGADIHVQDKDGWTALHCAAIYGQKATVLLLLDNGADIHAKLNNGNTALQLAAVNGQTATVELLLNRGADIHAKDSDGNTALHCAARYGRTATVELLLNRGADTHVKNKSGKTPVGLCCGSGPLLGWLSPRTAVSPPGLRSIERSVAKLGLPSPTTSSSLADDDVPRSVVARIRGGGAVIGARARVTESKATLKPETSSHSASVKRIAESEAAVKQKTSTAKMRTVELDARFKQCADPCSAARKRSTELEVSLQQSETSSQHLVQELKKVKDSSTSTAPVIARPLWHERYRVQTPPIGKGAQGEVYKALDAGDGSVWAIKRLPTSRFASGPEAARVQRQANAELDHLRDIHDPHIVHYRESFIHDNDLCVVLEYAEGGSASLRVATNISNGGVGLPPGVVMWTAVDILNALITLHGRADPIIHRDISPGNILYRKDGTALLSDFASSAMHSTLVDRTVSLFGTQEYLSPEGFAREPATTASDVWSLGAVLLYMLTGAKVCANDAVQQLLIRCVVRNMELWTLEEHMDNALKGESRDPITRKIVETPLGTIVTPAQQAAWKAAPESLRDVISRCLRVDPEHRSTASAILGLPCFNMLALRTEYGYRPLPAIADGATKRPSAGAA